MRRIPFSMVAVFLLASVAQAQEAPARAGRCYALEIGAWEPPFVRARQILTIPVRVRLRSDPHEGERGPNEGRAVDVLDARMGGEWPDPPDLVPVRYWEARGDSLRISFGTGYDGYVLDLGPSGPEGHREGRIEAWDDVILEGGPSDPVAPVTMRPASCVSADSGEYSRTPRSCDAPADGFLFGLLPGAGLGMYHAAGSEARNADPTIVAPFSAASSAS